MGGVRVVEAIVAIVDGSIVTSIRIASTDRTSRAVPIRTTTSSERSATDGRASAAALATPFSRRSGSLFSRPLATTPLSRRSFFSLLSATIRDQRVALRAQGVRARARRDRAGKAQRQGALPLVDAHKGRCEISSAVNNKSTRRRRATRGEGPPSWQLTCHDTPPPRCVRRDARSTRC